MGDVLGVIPARYGSSRLEGKPLAKIDGVTLLERVWNQARQATMLDRLVIATDDQRVHDVARKFGAESILTDPALTTGSARVEAAACIMSKERAGASWGAVVNIQGDMPFIAPSTIDQAIAMLKNAPDRWGMVTIALPLDREERMRDPNVVKVVVDRNGRALYFSRAEVPFTFSRATTRYLLPGVTKPVFGLQHLGLYVFRPDALSYFASAPPSALELRENLEQLRVLEGGFQVGVVVVESDVERQRIEVNTPDDLARAEQVLTHL